MTGTVGKPRLFKDAAELKACLDKYKAYLKESKKPPTIAGLAYYTGIERQTIYNYKEREGYESTLKDFRDWVIMTYEEVAIEKGGGGIIFLLKNYGYTDKSEHEISGDTSLNIKITGVE